MLVPPDYPDETPSTISDLPEDSAPIKSSSFKDIYNRLIINYIDSLIDLFFY